MMAHTHALSSALVFSLLNFNPSIVFLGVFMSILPDIDTPYSFIGKLLKPISKFINKRCGHRSVTHSFLALLTVSVFGFLINNQIGLVLMIGYSLHLFFDMLNPSGVPLLYPDCTSFVIFSGIIPVKGVRENWLFAILFIVLGVYLFTSFFNIDLILVIKSLVYKGG